MEVDRKRLKERFPSVSLGVFMMVAGISKFFIIEYWTGYEPQLILQLLPLTGEQLVLLGGVFEAVLGLVLISGRKAKPISLTVALYLTLITLQLINLGMWDLAVRDIGLVLYALTVYLVEK